MRLRVSPANQPANTIATEENWNIQQSRKSCDNIVLCARQIDYEGGSCRERSKWAEWLRAFRVVSACEHKQQNRMYDDQKCRNTERKPQRRQITHNWMSLGDEIMDRRRHFYASMDSHRDMNISFRRLWSWWYYIHVKSCCNRHNRGSMMNIQPIAYSIPASVLSFNCNHALSTITIGSTHKRDSVTVADCLRPYIHHSWHATHTSPEWLRGTKIKRRNNSSWFRFKFHQILNKTQRPCICRFVHYEYTIVNCSCLFRLLVLLVVVVWLNDWQKRGRFIAESSDSHQHQTSHTHTSLRRSTNQCNAHNKQINKRIWKLCFDRIYFTYTFE